MYLLHIVVVWIFHVQAEVASGLQNGTNMLQVEANSSCMFMLTNTSVQELAVIRKGMGEGEYDIVHIQIDIINDEAFDKLFPMSVDDKSDILTWVIATKTGRKLVTDVRNYKTDCLTKERSLNLHVYLQELQCVTQNNQGTDFIVKHNLNLLYNNLKGIDEIAEICQKNSISSTNLRMDSIFQPLYKCYDVMCLSSQNKTCEPFRPEGYTFLTLFARCWSYFLILYSPGFVYILYDCLHLTNGKHKHYHIDDSPFSLRRALAIISYIMISVVPKSKRDFSARPLVRTALLVWVFNMVIQGILFCLYFGNEQHFAFATYVFWSSVRLPPTIKLAIIETLLLVILILVVLILITYNAKPTKSIEDTYIYVFSSTGAVKSMFMRRKNLRQFINRKTHDVKEGQHFVLYHVDRFTLLFYARFWKWLILEAFSASLKERSSAIKRVGYVILGLLFGCVCLLFGSLLNLLWGLFPLIGVFLFVISTTKSWIDLVRSIVFFCLIALFIDILIFNNLIFALDASIYVVFYGLLTNKTNVHIFSQTLVFAGYLFLYWNRFIKEYKNLLDVLFEVENEMLNESSDSEKANKSSAEDVQKIKHQQANDENKVSRIFIREFDFVSEQCLPVRKKLISLVLKLLLTGTFLLIASTVLFLKRRMYGFADVGKLVLFLLISVLPKVIENVLKKAEIDKDQIKLKVLSAVKEWKNTTIKKVVTGDNKSNDVDCVWIACCKKEGEAGSNKEITDMRML